MSCDPRTLALAMTYAARGAGWVNASIDAIFGPGSSAGRISWKRDAELLFSRQYQTAIRSARRALTPTEMACLAIYSVRQLALSPARVGDGNFCEPGSFVARDGSCVPRDESWGSVLPASPGGAVGGSCPCEGGKNPFDT